MTMPDPRFLDALRAIVARATPGPWYFWSQEGSDGYGIETYSVCNDDPGIQEGTHQCVARSSGKTNEDSEANATYIATFNPALLTRLLDVVEAASKLRFEPYPAHGVGFTMRVAGGDVTKLTEALTALRRG